MRDSLPPEVVGCLNLAERHERLAWKVSPWFPGGRLVNPKHASKAQKLRRRAEVLMGRRKGA